MSDTLRTISPVDGRIYDNLAPTGTGVTNSRRDCALSSVGFELLTRPKSYHFGITREKGTARL
jgi:hypothetical protein